jgi:hypothetical protein
MPSAALIRWHADRLTRLTHIDAHCAALLLPPVASPSPLAHESLQGYVMLLSGHFQGFCRDLYTECLQLCAAVVPPRLSATVQAQFGAEVKLNSGNPTVPNIRKDFERFGFLLDLAARIRRTLCESPISAISTTGGMPWLIRRPLRRRMACRPCWPCRMFRHGEGLAMDWPFAWTV